MRQIEVIYMTDKKKEIKTDIGKCLQNIFDTGVNNLEADKNTVPSGSGNAKPRTNAMIDKNIPITAVSNSRAITLGLVSSR